MLNIITHLYVKINPRPVRVRTLKPFQSITSVHELSIGRGRNTKAKLAKHILNEYGPEISLKSVKIN